MKPQLIRLADVLVLGPFMMYSGARKSTLPAFFRAGLVAAGALTVIYNGRNYYQKFVADGDAGFRWQV